MDGEVVVAFRDRDYYTQLEDFRDVLLSSNYRIALNNAVRCSFDDSIMLSDQPEELFLSCDS